MVLRKVLIVNTGGTLCMVHAERGNPLSPLVPAASWEEIVAGHPILASEILGIEVGYRAVSQLIDSSQMQQEHWQEIARIIAANYEDYSGFVVVHGTDTMCYTASALSFMLENLGKPVILTGSQRPLVEPRSDAAQNLVTSLQLAGGDTFGYPVIPEVCIFFRDHLLRGNRARKMSASGYSGFESPNFPALATAGEHVVVDKKLIRAVPEGRFAANTSLDSRVMVLEIFPGFKPGVLRRLVEEGGAEEDAVKGLILKTYGTGNAPSNRAFLEAVGGVCEQGVVVVNVTQCPQGMVELGLYEASVGLLQRGVVSGVDMTPEAAVCKMMYLLGQGLPTEEVKRMMQMALVGEQNMDVYSVALGGLDDPLPLAGPGAVLPSEIRMDALRSAILQLRGVQSRGPAMAESEVELRLFLNSTEVSESPDVEETHCAAVVRRPTKGGEEFDVVCDVSAASRRLLRPGQTVSVAVVPAGGGTVRWRSMHLTLYSDVA